MNVNASIFLSEEKLPPKVKSTTTSVSDSHPIPNVIKNFYAHLNTINTSHKNYQQQHCEQQNVHLPPNTCSSLSSSSSTFIPTSVITSTSGNSDTLAGALAAQRINENCSNSHYRYVKPQTCIHAAASEWLGVEDKSIQFRRDVRLRNESNQEWGEDSMLVFQGNTLISGSLESLVRHMVPTSTYYPDHNFIFAFLLSARVFIRPHELLARISQAWESQLYLQHQQQTAMYAISQLACIGKGAFAAVSQKHKSTVAALSKDKEQQLITQISAQRCIRLLSEWIEMFPYDFRDESLMQQVRILTRKCVYIDNTLGKQVSSILQQLVQRLTALEIYENRLQMLFQQQKVLCDKPMANSFTFCGTTMPASSFIKSSLSNLVSSSINANENRNICNQTFSTEPLTKTNFSNSLNNYIDSSTEGNVITSANLPLVVSSAKSITTLSEVDSASALSSSTHINLPVSSPNSLMNELCGIMVVCPSCSQLAHQLTAIELERLSHIGLEEFVQAFAKEYKVTATSYDKSDCVQGDNLSIYETSLSTSSSNIRINKNTKLSSSWHKDVKKTRNLEVYIDWFNRLSYFIATEIVKCVKRKHRVRIIEYWIETARECFNIGNFNSLMSIIAGLNLAPIARLKKTWSKVHLAKFAVLEHQMDPTANFHSYRATLKAAMWRSEGATEERERIIIPFFSLFVKDIYFLNESCSNRLSNNHINFEKWSQLAKQIMEFNEWKKVTCPFEVCPSTISYLQSSPVFNENTLAMSSFACEPPENNEEKCRYKTVKAESKQRQCSKDQEQQ